MKKILVSDYDGTFYLNDKDINNNIKKVNELKKKRKYICNCYWKVILRFYEKITTI